MHELSLALHILEAVGEESRRLNAAVSAVHVRVGPLSGVDKGALVGAFEMARERTEMRCVRLEVEETRLVIECPACRGERTARSLTDLRCAACGGEPSAVRGGRELEVFAVEIES